MPSRLARTLARTTLGLCSERMERKRVKRFCGVERVTFGSEACEEASKMNGMRFAACTRTSPTENRANQMERIRSRDRDLFT